MEHPADWRKFNPPSDARAIFERCPRLTVAGSVAHLVELATGRNGHKECYEVVYDIPGQGAQVEATVVRVRNGVAVNYSEPYMRRRDPDCMLVADDLPTDKATFDQRFGVPFDRVREETLDWLADAGTARVRAVCGPGRHEHRHARRRSSQRRLLRAWASPCCRASSHTTSCPAAFSPRAVIYVAPPFRHTHFGGKQVVVHNRQPGLHEMFSFNLYPGPSAKKGIYGVLIALGEREGWVTAHCSTVQVVTPYDNVVTIMHEGASGGGKSEMLEHAHREPDGRLLLGENLVTGEKRYLEIPRAASCTRSPTIWRCATCVANALPRRTASCGCATPRTPGSSASTTSNTTAPTCSSSD